MAGAKRRSAPARGAPAQRRAARLGGSRTSSSASTRRASVYVQASWHEGFGMAVAEAMLAGCVPVVRDAGAMPEVVGDAGVLIAGSEPEQIAEGVRRRWPRGRRAAGGRASACSDAFPLAARRQRLQVQSRGCWPSGARRGTRGGARAAGAVDAGDARVSRRAGGRVEGARCAARRRACLLACAPGRASDGMSLLDRFRLDGKVAASSPGPRSGGVREGLAEAGATW